LISVLIGQQQTLNIRLNQSVSLDNYVVGDNQPLLASLVELAASSSETKIMYIWGDSGVGKTH